MRSHALRQLFRLLLLLLPLPALADQAEVDAYIRQAMIDWTVPGLAVAVVKDGQVVLARGYGTRESGRELAVDEHTLFGIGSTTKSFTAAAAAMLVDDGKLAWDDAINDYLPALQFHDPWITEQATVRDLASHRVGIDANFPWVIRSWDTNETLRRIRHLESRARFGNYDYSNTGITALGRIVEVASGVSWDDFIARRVFKPLGMDDSNTDEKAYVKAKHLAPCWLCEAPPGAAIGQQALRGWRTNAASPHGLREGGQSLPGDTPRDLDIYPFRYERSIAPAGAINSTAADMAQWLLLHLGHGPADDDELLSDEQLAQIHAYQTLVKFPTLEPAADASPVDATKQIPGYGLGWFKSLYRGHIVSHHPGGQVGFGAIMWLVPDADLGVVVLQNLDWRHCQAHAGIARWLVDHYLGLPPEDWSRHELKRWSGYFEASSQGLAGVEKLASREAPDDAAAYSGHFDSPAMGPASVAVEDGVLVLRFSDHAAAELHPINSQNFLAVFRGADRWRASVRFSMNMTGQADSFVFGETFGASQPFRYHRVQP